MHSLDALPRYARVRRTDGRAHQAALTRLARWTAACRENEVDPLERIKEYELNGLNR